MRKPLLLAALGLAAAPVAFGQALLEENFSYPAGTQMGGTGTVPTAANPTTGWATHSGVTNQLLVNGTGSTFASIPVYPSQSGGSLALVSTQSEDISHQFAQQVEGVTTVPVYVSALVTPNAEPNGTNGSYFLHVAQNTVGGTTFRGRVFMGASPNPGNVRFGITVAGNTAVMGTTDVPIGTTVLLVMRYDIVPGPANDGARLYLLPAGANIATEPLIPEALAADVPASDPANIGAVAIRQGTTTSGSAQNSGSQTIDGVRVGLSWDDAPLPVELNAFTGAADGTTARLAWTTASETNNVGFGIEQLQGASWTERGFVAGHGTTTERNTYAFDVANLTAGRHTFRLRQIDTDGTVNYSPLVSVEIGVASSLTLTALGTRALRVQSETDATVAVYDLLGRQVMTQRVEPGTSEMRFDGLSAGVYVVRATAGAAATTLSVVVR